MTRKEAVVVLVVGVVGFAAGVVEIDSVVIVAVAAAADVVVVVVVSVVVVVAVVPFDSSTVMTKD